MKKFTSESQKMGLIGEDLACRYLKEQGFLIVERNFTKRFGEIDVVAEKQGKLHFIEVKSVSRENIEDISHETGIRPEENMHPAKMQRMAKVVELYLAEKEVSEDWQIDLVCVFIQMNPKRARVQFWEDVILG